MTEQITRRLFLKRAAIGIAATTVDPEAVFKWLNKETFQGAGTTQTDRLVLSASSSQRGKSLEQAQDSVADEEIPLKFFYPGYTQDQLQEAWHKEYLVNGFPWGQIDTHTLGGVPDPKNVTVDKDGSAILTIRRPTSSELTAWEADPIIGPKILEGEKNKLEMKLSVAAFTGRLPTDMQSIEASITLPQRVVSGDPTVGMVGTGWTLWTQPDLDRLAANLAKVGASSEEISEIVARIEKDSFEEDIAEFSLGEPRPELGYPLWLRILGGQVITFLSGRKTATRKFPLIDIMHLLYEPIDVAVPPLFFLQEKTLRGWLAKNGENTDRALTQPLRVKLEVGKEVYDATRDAMVMPMTFWLNDKQLSPTATSNFPGLEDDPTGSAPSNLSLWKVKTRAGDWVSVPRKFVIDFCSSTRHEVKGETDYVRFSNVLITRRTE